MSAQVPLPSDCRPVRSKRVPMDTAGTASQQSNSINMTTTTMRWNTEQLVQLESALQLYFAQPRVVGLRHVQRSNSDSHKNKNDFLLPLNDFYALTRKLSLPPPTVTGDTSTATNEQQQQGERRDEKKEEEGVEKQYTYDLNEMELLLFQLLCVSFPVLYRLARSKGGGSRNDGDDDDDDDNPNNNNKNKCCCWCLERIPTPENRTSQLHKLIKERDARTSQTNAQSKIFLQAIREHRKLWQPKVSTTPNTTTTTASRTTSTATQPTKQTSIGLTNSTTIIQPGMTVEERVRARANAKRKFQDEDEKKSQSTDASSNEHDRSWLVRLADALWSHASSILQRQARFQSPQRKSMITTTTTTTRQTVATATTVAGRPSHCSLTLKDVIYFLRQSSLSTPLMNKRKIAEGIQELHRIVPEWIVLSDPGSLSPDTTVWLNPAEYKTIRYRLTGEEPPPKKKALFDVNHRHYLNDGSPKTAKTTTTALQTNKETPTLASPFLAGNETATKAAAAAAATTSGPLNNLVTKIQQGAVLARMTRRRTPAVSMSPSAFTGKLSGTKRASEQLTTTAAAAAAAATTHSTTNTTTSTPSTPVTKKRKGLRVNPNLILTDADYEGGEVIRPTSFDSPRGLKSLFDQMKAGRRI